MPAEDELRELAADIKQRGQLQPIMLDDQGRILDGRNRNAAWHMLDLRHARRRNQAVKER